MKYFCDNNSAISIAHNPMQHYKTKDIERNRHLMKEKIDNDVIAIAYIPSRLLMVDVFTKKLLLG